MVKPVDEGLAEALSAVMDGQATAADWARVKVAWAGDPALRERWAAWHAAADGLRAPDLPALQQPAEDLLAALHARLSIQRAGRPRREWLPSLAVAASFVALAVGVAALRPAPPVPEATVAATPFTPSAAQGLGGLSFAQTAAGRNLPGDLRPEVVDWSLALPEPASSQPLP